MKTKWLAVGIILLFVGVTIAPAMNANDDEISSKTFSMPTKEKMSSIAVFEYKADGSIVKSIVKMSRGKIDKFRAELKDVIDTDIQLSIYKKYNLIPENVTSETLYDGMEEKALRIGLTKDKLEQLGFIDKNMFSKQNNQNRKRFFFFNMKCMIDANFAAGFVFPLGFSFFTLVLNLLGKEEYSETIKIFDIRDTIISVYTEIITENGPFDFKIGLFFSLTKVIGFVGYLFYYIEPVMWGLSAICIGSAAYVRSIGIPYPYVDNKIYDV